MFIFSFCSAFTMNLSSMERFVKMWHLYLPFLYLFGNLICHQLKTKKTNTWTARLENFSSQFRETTFILGFLKSKDSFERDRSFVRITSFRNVLECTLHKLICSSASSRNNLEVLPPRPVSKSIHSQQWQVTFLGQHNLITRIKKFQLQNK